MDRKKTKLHVEDLSKVFYAAPYYIIGTVSYHEDWYEVVEGMFHVEELVPAIERLLESH